MRIATTAPTTPPPPNPSKPHKATRIAPLLVLLAVLSSGGCERDRGESFDGGNALALVERQMAFGPRVPGTASSVHTAQWIQASLADLGWGTSVVSTLYHGVQLSNVIGKRGSSSSAGPVIVGTHFDTRPHADRDSIDPTAAVPGADDGASGVAVLLELARVLPADMGDLEVWLAFFDGEDSGNLEGWEWSAGATAYAAELAVRPQAVVIVDMVGDSDLRIPRERTSDIELTDEIWAVARDLGADAFVDDPGIAILDDHRPFLALGVPAVLIIDLEYDYWHTTADTLDKVSAGSLEQVGSVLQAWILSRR
jgi:Zn-dependent M28 family amino/carboxypeptidase